MLGKDCTRLGAGLLKGCCGSRVEKIGQSIQWEPLFSLGQAAELHVQLGREWYIQTGSSQVQEIKTNLSIKQPDLPCTAASSYSAGRTTNSAQLSSKFAINRKGSVLTSGQKHQQKTLLLNSDNLVLSQ